VKAVPCVSILDRRMDSYGRSEMNVIAANNFVKHESVNAAEAIQFAIAGCESARSRARSRTGVCAILRVRTRRTGIELGKIFPDDCSSATSAP